MSAHRADGGRIGVARLSPYDRARRLVTLAGRERSARRRDRLYREATTLALLALVEGAGSLPTSAEPLYTAAPRAAGTPDLWARVAVYLFDLALGHPDYPDRADPLVAPWLRSVPRDHLEQRVLEFLTEATGGPTRAARVHTGEDDPLPEQVWEALTHHLGTALRAYSVPAEHVTELLTLTGPLRHELGTQP